VDHRDIIKPKELEHSLYQFLNGWLEFLSYSRRPHTDSDEAHILVNEFVDLNVKSIS
jgi:hypothetical protein